jgi:hypothetical protein
MTTFASPRAFASVAIAIVALMLAGCPSKSDSGSSSSGGASKKLDGVYHGAPGSPITLTLKGGKATMTIGNESKTLDYKVEGNKLTILNPKEGDAVFTINDDGTLNSELGVLTKSPS